MNRVQKIVIATRNKGKIKEMQAMLDDLGVEIISSEEISGLPEIQETGETFLENAIKKAVETAKYSGLMAIADDSGLEVDALGGRPGVYSSRYAGEQASDRDNYLKLLKEMENIPEQERTARFRAVIVAAKPDGTFIYAEGSCPGRIALEPQGTEGFGYDPVFYLPEREKTMAEISKEDKNRISHRGKAMIKLKEKLKEFM